MAGFVLLVVIGTSIWVLTDAKSLEIGTRRLNGVVDSGPWVWFFGCLLLWIVVFPYYLVKRGRYKDRDSAGSFAGPQQNTMKKCPFCAEGIQEAAVFCKHCKRELTAR